MENKGSCAIPVSCSTEQKKEGSCGPKDCGPKKGCCGKLIAGAFAGAIVAFLYLMASWTLLPWHMQALHGFKNEVAVGKAIQSGAPQSGVYILPLVTSPGQKPAIAKPFAFVSVFADGPGDLGKTMKAQLGREFVLCLLIAGLLTCLLKKQGAGCPVASSMKIGLIVALAHNVPNIIWWHFPLDFSLISAADDFLAVTLAGVVISKIVLGCSKKAGACSGCGCTDCKCKAGGSCGTAPKGSCGA